jgi:hypothetical protein
MRIEVVSKDVGVRKTGAKARAVQKYSPTRQKTKMWKQYLKIGGSCWGKRIEFKLADKI